MKFIHTKNKGGRCWHRRGKESGVDIGVLNKQTLTHMAGVEQGCAFTFEDSVLWKRAHTKGQGVDETDSICT
jgi:hypothetical protein